MPHLLLNYYAKMESYIWNKKLIALNKNEKEKKISGYNSIYYYVYRSNRVFIGWMIRPYVVFDSETWNSFQDLLCPTISSFYLFLLHDVKLQLIITFRIAFPKLL